MTENSKAKETENLKEKERKEAAAGAETEMKSESAEKAAANEKTAGSKAGKGAETGDKAEKKSAGSAENKASENKEGSGKEAASESAEDEDMKTKYLRLMADFQNYRRRTESEKADIYARANERLVGSLLDVIDNFDRAMAQGENTGDGFAKGISLVYKQFMDVLTKEGLSEIEALGLEFDPNFHNAVMTEDSAEYESGKVSCVLQKGYMLNKKVIRPSMVKVAN